MNHSVKWLALHPFIIVLVLILFLLCQLVWV